MNQELILAGVVFPVGLALAGWVAPKVYRIWQTPERLDGVTEDIKYVRDRVDSIYDALISAPRRPQA